MATFSPSLMCMDYGKMKEQFETMDKYIDLYHVDIMDGHLCKNMALTPAVMKGCRTLTDTAMDVHMMTTDPFDWFEMCAQAGATYLSPHAETINGRAFRAMNVIKSLGCKCGVVLNPETPLSYVESYLDYVDLLTLMTVDIGFAGQDFIDQMYEKIEEAKRLREEKGYHYKIQIDGHCNKENYKRIVDAGGDILIVGNAGLFGLDENIDTACQKMLAQYEECMAN